MTGGTARREASHRMIRIRRSGVVRRVTRVTIRRNGCVVVVHMTKGTLRRGVRAD